MMQTEQTYTVKKLRDGMWSIRERHVHMYLFDGRDKAILLDTGVGSGNARELIEGLVRKPVQVIITHSHNDHTGALRQFDDVYVHELEAADIDPEGELQNAGILHFVSEGDVLSNGLFSFEVLHTPGHTPGGISLLERKNKMLFVGDNLSENPVYMCLPGSDIKVMEETLQRIDELADEYDIIYANHSTCEMPKSSVQESMVLCQKILDGSAQWEPDVYFGSFPCRRCIYKNASMLVL